MSPDLRSVTWPNGASIAVSLMYEGGYPEHLHTVAPLLDVLEIRATFFLSPPAALKSLSNWKTIAQRGHEIGNACLHGVTLNGELPNWTLRTVEQDLYMTQNFLREMFPGQSPDSFLYEGHFADCAQGPYRELIDAEFAYSVHQDWGLRLRDMDEATRFGAVVQPGVDLENIQTPWAGIRIGEIGPGKDQVSPEVHEQYLRLLTTCSNWWIAPVSEVGRHLKAHIEK